jgi:hypothetical protein
MMRLTVLSLPLKLVLPELGITVSCNNIPWGYFSCQKYPEKIPYARTR